MSRILRTATIPALALTLLAPPASAQYSVGVGMDYLGYSFDQGLGTDAAQLILVPVAVRVPATSKLTFDLYAAWAEGRIERNNTQSILRGVVDTQIKASYQATPWALVTMSANVPTGNSSHTGPEAVVASVLATDLLGFRESSWGTGFALTSSVATAVSAGGFGLGLAGAYALRGKFEPSEQDPSLEYQPGSETRVRLGVDRNFGNSTFTAGATFITYTDDQANGRNLFQAGNRMRFDGTYAFRSGGGVWTIYAADLIRQKGDLFLDVVDDVGTIVGDTTLVTPKQNLLIAGVVGTVSLGGGFVFRPHVDYRLQTRTNPATDSKAGSGWMIAAGGDIPVRIFGGYEFFPKARVLFGSIKDPSESSVSLLGLEFKGTVRWSF